jgi:molybdate transport system substrate-binding protein
MNTAISAGVVESGTQKPLVTNKLVVIVSKAAASKITGLGDLVKPGIKIVLADQSVPAGNYSLQALRKLSSDKAGYGASYQRQVLANVVSKETNVRQVAAKVQLGEADAGIVYTTDAKAAMQASPQAVTTIDIPDASNVLADYYIAPLKNAPHPEASRRFIAYALSPEGQQVLRSFGFGPPAGGDE